MEDITELSYEFLLEVLSKQKCFVILLAIEYWYFANTVRQLNVRIQFLSECINVFMSAETMSIGMFAK